MILDLITSNRVDPDSVRDAVTAYTVANGGAYSINCCKAQGALTALLSRGCVLRNSLLELRYPVLELRAEPPDVGVYVSPPDVGVYIDPPTTYTPEEIDREVY